MSVFNRRRACGVLLTLTMPLAVSPALAQPTATALTDDALAIAPNAVLADPPGRVLDLDAELARGRALLERRDRRAPELLRRVAQNAAAQLAAASGNAVLLAQPDQMPRVGYEGQLARQTAEAHLLWGQACDVFGQRDMAITALCRAIRFAGPTRFAGVTGRDARLSLSAILSDGLPIVAPNDVMQTLASLSSQVPETAWTPLVFRSVLPDPGTSANNTSANPNGSANLTREFLLTSGWLLPPVSRRNGDTIAKMTRVPPLYRGVADEKLPPPLKLDKVIYGYERQTSGANRVLWRQVVQVFYASPLVASEGRDDRPRAEALCQSFLKVQALYRDALGLVNRYDRQGITQIYLSEYSALWPDDEDDPVTRAAMGVKMPPPNTTLRPGQQLAPTVPLSPLVRVWRPVAARNGQTVGAAQMDASPGEIIFFKMTRARPESEWLRELIHEYGHVVVPAFGPYAPPNEPYANGALGENLATLWIAGNPAAFASSAPPPQLNALSDISTGNVNPGAPAANGARRTLPLEVSVVRAQVGAVVSALRFWGSRGPGSPLARAATPDGWRYLQGLSVYLERVYGPEFLGAALNRLPQTSSRPMFAIDLQNALSGLSLNRGRTLKVWLPGALDGFITRGDDLVGRAPMRLPGARVGAWLWVPPGAKSLRVEWRGSGNLRVNGFASAPASPAGALAEALPRVAGQSTGAEPASERALLINVSARAGWQRFTFAPSGVVTLTSARFEG